MTGGELLDLLMDCSFPKTDSVLRIWQVVTQESFSQLASQYHCLLHSITMSSAVGPTPSSLLSVSILVFCSMFKPSKYPTVFKQTDTSNPLLSCCFALPPLLFFVCVPSFCETHLHSPSLESIYNKGEQPYPKSVLPFVYIQYIYQLTIECLRSYPLCSSSTRQVGFKINLVHHRTLYDFRSKKSCRNGTKIS